MHTTTDNCEEYYARTTHVTAGRAPRVGPRLDGGAGGQRGRRKCATGTRATGVQTGRSEEKEVAGRAGAACRAVVRWRRERAGGRMGVGGRLADRAKMQAASWGRCGRGHGVIRVYDDFHCT